MFNDRGEMRVRAQVTPKVRPGVVWSRDGWFGLNGLASNAPALPVHVTDVLPIPSGQAAYEALVEVAPAR